jgi:hypothetical protein
MTKIKLIDHVACNLSQQGLNVFCEDHKKVLYKGKLPPKERQYTTLLMTAGVIESNRKKYQKDDDESS